MEIMIIVTVIMMIIVAIIAIIVIMIISHNGVNNTLITRGFESSRNFANKLR